MYAYREASALQRLARWTAPTRPMTWLYKRIQQGIDEFVYRRTRGRETLSSLMSGLPVVMLTTKGAKTGQPRTLPVLGIPDGEEIIVIASNYGRPSHPAWYRNLQAHPTASVAINGASYQVAARELIGEERDRHFQRAATMYPGFLKYQQYAPERRIPVIKLVKQRV